MEYSHAQKDLRIPFYPHSIIEYNKLYKGKSLKLGPSVKQFKQISVGNISAKSYGTMVATVKI